MRHWGCAGGSHSRDTSLGLRAPLVPAASLAFLPAWTSLIIPKGLGEKKLKREIKGQCVLSPVLEKNLSKSLKVLSWHMFVCTCESPWNSSCAGRDDPVASAGRAPAAGPDIGHILLWAFCPGHPCSFTAQTSTSSSSCYSCALLEHSPVQPKVAADPQRGFIPWCEERDVTLAGCRAQLWGQGCATPQS